MTEPLVFSTNVDIDPRGLVRAINMCLPNVRKLSRLSTMLTPLYRRKRGLALPWVLPSFVLIALGTGVGAGVV